MMHSPFNIRTRFLMRMGATLVGLVLLCSPLTVFGAEATSTTVSSTTRPDTTVRGVCMRLVSLEGAMTAKLTTAQSSYNSSASDRMIKLRTLASKRDVEDAETRKTADARLLAYIASLHTQARGDKTKDDAVTAFAGVVTKATVTRRMAVDSALKSFTDGLKALADDRDAQVKAKANSLTGDIKTALGGAKSSCGSGVDPKEVRATLHTTLAGLTSSYKTSLEDRRHFYDGIQAVTDVRKREVSDATATYTDTLNKASQDLHTVLR